MGSSNRQVRLPDEAAKERFRPIAGDLIRRLSVGESPQVAQRARGFLSQLLPVGHVTAKRVGGGALISCSCRASDRAS
jgi:hypothetical protein